MTAPSLSYLYGIVAVAAPDPSGVAGLEGAPVRLVRAGDVAGIVSDVPADDYAESVLDARLADLDWVGVRGLAHERVLTWFEDRGTVVPLAPFSLHASDARVVDRLTEQHDRLHAELARLAGRREWGVRVWREERRFAERVDALSAPLRALAEEERAATPGRRFLIARKRDALRADEARRVSAELVERVLSRLRARAEEGKALPIPAAPGVRERTLLLHAAFLVSADRYAGFEGEVQALAAATQDDGFAWEFTGPWPPYHFAKP